MARKGRRKVSTCEKESEELIDAKMEDPAENIHKRGKGAKGSKDVRSKFEPPTPEKTCLETKYKPRKLNSLSRTITKMIFRAKGRKRRSKIASSFKEDIVISDNSQKSVAESSVAKIQDIEEDNFERTLMSGDESKDSKFSTSRGTKKSKKRRWGRGKKGHKPLDVSSESESSIEEITEEEEPKEPLVFEENEEEFAREEVDEDDEPIIVKRARTGKKVRNDSTPVEPGVNDDKPCHNCGKYDQPEWILLCNKCDKGYHTHCLEPPLSLIPDGDWYCQPCEHDKEIVPASLSRLEDNREMNNLSLESSMLSEEILSENEKLRLMVQEMNELNEFLQRQNNGYVQKLSEAMQDSFKAKLEKESLSQQVEYLKRRNQSYVEENSSLRLKVQHLEISLVQDVSHNHTLGLECSKLSRLEEDMSLREKSVDEPNDRLDILQTIISEKEAIHEDLKNNIKQNWALLIKFRKKLNEKGLIDQEDNLALCDQYRNQSNVIENFQPEDHEMFEDIMSFAPKSSEVSKNSFKGKEEDQAKNAFIPDSLPINPTDLEDSASFTCRSSQNSDKDEEEDQAKNAFIPDSLPINPTDLEDSARFTCRSSENSDKDEEEDQAKNAHVPNSSLINPTNHTVNSEMCETGVISSIPNSDLVPCDDNLQIHSKNDSSSIEKNTKAKSKKRKQNPLFIKRTKRRAAKNAYVPNSSLINPTNHTVDSEMCETGVNSSVPNSDLVPCDDNLQIHSKNDSRSIEKKAKSKKRKQNPLFIKRTKRRAAIYSDEDSSESEWSDDKNELIYFDKDSSERELSVNPTDHESYRSINPKDHEHDTSFNCRSSEVSKNSSKDKEEDGAKNAFIPDSLLINPTDHEDIMRFIPRLSEVSKSSVEDKAKNTYIPNSSLINPTNHAVDSKLCETDVNSSFISNDLVPCDDNLQIRSKTDSSSIEKNANTKIPNNRKKLQEGQEHFWNKTFSDEDFSDSELWFFSDDKKRKLKNIKSHLDSLTGFDLEKEVNKSKCFVVLERLPFHVDIDTPVLLEDSEKHEGSDLELLALKNIASNLEIISEKELYNFHSEDSSVRNTENTSIDEEVSNNETQTSSFLNCADSVSEIPKKPIPTKESRWAKELNPESKSQWNSWLNSSKINPTPETFLRIKKQTSSSELGVQLELEDEVSFENSEKTVGSSDSLDKLIDEINNGALRNDRENSGSIEEVSEEALLDELDSDNNSCFDFSVPHSDEEIIRSKTPESSWERKIYEKVNENELKTQCNADTPSQGSKVRTNKYDEIINRSKTPESSWERKVYEKVSELETQCNADTPSQGSKVRTSKYLLSEFNLNKASKDHQDSSSQKAAKEAFQSPLSPEQVGEVGKEQVSPNPKVSKPKQSSTYETSIPVTSTECEKSGVSLEVKSKWNSSLNSSKRDSISGMFLIQEGKENQKLPSESSMKFRSKDGEIVDKDHEEGLEKELFGSCESIDKLIDEIDSEAFRKEESNDEVPVDLISNCNGSSKFPESNFDEEIVSETPESCLEIYSQKTAKKNMIETKSESHSGRNMVKTVEEFLSSQSPLSPDPVVEVETGEPSSKCVTVDFMNDCVDSNSSEFNVSKHNVHESDGQNADIKGNIDCDFASLKKNSSKFSDEENSITAGTEGFTLSDSALESILVKSPSKSIDLPDFIDSNFTFTDQTKSNLLSMPIISVSETLLQRKESEISNESTLKFDFVDNFDHIMLSSTPKLSFQTNSVKRKTYHESDATSELSHERPSKILKATGASPEKQSANERTESHFVNPEGSESFSNILASRNLNQNAPSIVEDSDFQKSLPLTNEAKNVCLGKELDSNDQSHLIESHFEESNLEHVKSSPKEKSVLNISIDKKSALPSLKLTNKLWNKAKAITSNPDEKSCVSRSDCIDKPSKYPSVISVSNVEVRDKDNSLFDSTCALITGENNSDISSDDDTLVIACDEGFSPRNQTRIVTNGLNQSSPLPNREVKNKDNSLFNSACMDNSNINADISSDDDALVIACEDEEVKNELSPRNQSSSLSNGEVKDNDNSLFHSACFDNGDISSDDDALVIACEDDKEVKNELSPRNQSSSLSNGKVKDNDNSLFHSACFDYADISSDDDTLVIACEDEGVENELSPTNETRRVTNPSNFTSDQLSPLSNEVVKDKNPLLFDTALTHVTKVISSNVSSDDDVLVMAYDSEEGNNKQSATYETRRVANPSICITDQSSLLQNEVVEDMNEFLSDTAHSSVSGENIVDISSDEKASIVTCDTKKVRNKHSLKDKAKKMSSINNANKGSELKSIDNQSVSTESSSGQLFSTNTQNAQLSVSTNKSLEATPGLPQLKLLSSLIKSFPLKKDSQLNSPANPPEKPDFTIVESNSNPTHEYEKGENIKIKGRKMLKNVSVNASDPYRLNRSAQFQRQSIIFPPKPKSPERNITIQLQNLEQFEHIFSRLLKSRQSRIYNTTLEDMLFDKFTSSIPSKESLLHCIFFYLERHRHNPFLKDLKHSDVLLFQDELCLVNVLFRLQQPHFKCFMNITEASVQAIYHILLAKKSMRLYTMGGLCRVFTAICKRLQDPETPLRFCAEVLKMKHRNSIFYISCVAGVWKDIFQVHEFMSDEESIFQHAISFGTRKNLRTFLYFYPQSIGNIQSFLDKTLFTPKEFHLGSTIEYLVDSVVENYQKGFAVIEDTISSLIIFAVYSKNIPNILNKYIIPNLERNQTNYDAFEVFSYIYVYLISRCPNHRKEEWMTNVFEKTEDNQIRDISAASLIKIHIERSLKFPSNLQSWLKENKDEPVLKSLLPILKRAKYPSIETLTPDDIFIPEI